jgi:hypothetical protein
MTGLDIRPYQSGKVKASASAAFLGGIESLQFDYRPPLQIGHKTDDSATRPPIADGQRA